MQSTETKHAHKYKAKKDKGSTNEILGLGSRRWGPLHSPYQSPSFSLFLYLFSFPAWDIIHASLSSIDHLLIFSIFF